jgi:hypothetical protein
MACLLSAKSGHRYSITLSARTRIAGGIVMASSAAVFRLKYETRRFLDRQIGRACALEYHIGQRSRASVTLVEVGPER